MSAPRLFVVVGPTASGKSALAMALAHELGGEIINADSVQIYRDFDIGSGKPSIDDLRRVPHHLVSLVDPREPMDAARFAALADVAIDEIRGRGKVPVVCGGTFLWVRALLHGLLSAPPSDPAIRARHTREAEEHGRPALHQRLCAVDPESATRIAPNDFVRVSRALEVWEMTGRTMSDWQSDHGFRQERYDAHLVGVRWSPNDLTHRIAARTQSFLERGWIDEVRSLVARGHRDTRAMASVGYRQVLAHVEGQLSASELAPSIDRATKIFARRQRTWLRDRIVTWLDGAELFAHGHEADGSVARSAVGSTSL